MSVREILQYTQTDRHPITLYKDIYVHLSGIQVIMNESFNDGWQLRLDQEVAGGLEPVNQGSNGGTHLKLFIHIING